MSAATRNPDGSPVKDKDLDARHAIAAECYGHWLWQHTVLVPGRQISGLPRALSKHHDNRFIAGWLYDRSSERNFHGIGPGETYGAWVATVVGYVTNETICPGCTQTVTKVVNPYLHWKYLGEYERLNRAEDAVRNAFEKLHDLMLA